MRPQKTVASLQDELLSGRQAGISQVSRFLLVIRFALRRFLEKKAE
jgi:hypothetical protein